MSVDRHAEHCPNCRSIDLDKVRAFGRWFTKCGRCGLRDDGYDRAETEARQKRREAAREREAT